MKTKKPKHCKGCVYYHQAGHKQGSRLFNSNYNNWCCKYSTSAPKAVSICLQQDGKSTKSVYAS